MDMTYEEVNQSTLSTNEIVGEKKTFRYAGFWMRFWAFLIDMFVIGALNRIIINPFFSFELIPDPLGTLPTQAILTAIIGYAYFVLMTKFAQQTLGKMVLGLKVINKEGESLSWTDCIFREVVGKIISKVGFVGYIIAGFTPKKQSLHDLFADTYVIHTKE